MLSKNWVLIATFRIQCFVFNFQNNEYEIDVLPLSHHGPHCLVYLLIQMRHLYQDEIASKMQHMCDICKKHFHIEITA